MRINGIGRESRELTNPSTDQSLAQALPLDIVRRAFLMTISEHAASLTVGESNDVFFKRLFLLPKCLAYLTGYDEFKKMPLGPELFKLLRMAKILRHKLYLAFRDDSELIPESKLTFDYVNAAIFQNIFMSDWEKGVYFCNLARGLCRQGNIEILGYLIEAVTDNVAFAGFEKTDSDGGDIAYKLAMTNLNIALKLFRLAERSWKRERMLSFILLAPMNEAKLDSTLSIMKFSCKHFIRDILNAMTVRASDCRCTKYFSSNNCLVYKNNMIFLDRIEAEASNDAKIWFTVSYVRLLYAIRLGCELESEISDPSVKEIANTANGPLTSATDRLFNAISALELLPTQVATLTELFRYLLLTTIHAQNRELFTRLVPYIQMLEIEDRLKIISQRNIEGVLSFADYKKLLGSHKSLTLIGWLKTMRFCKMATGVCFDGEWTCEFKKRSDHLVILAEARDEAKFEAAIQKLNENNRLEILNEAMRDILEYIDNPILFVKIILKAGYYASHGYIFGRLKFMRALTLDSNGDDGIVELLSQYEIRPELCFFDTLLDDNSLKKMFQCDRIKRLWKTIRFARFECSSRKDQIVEILKILQIPVMVGEEAFSLHGVSTDELNAKFKKFHLFFWNLADLDRYALEPGFLAYLSLTYNHSGIITDGVRRDITLKGANPLDFWAYNLIRKWVTYNKKSFVQYADWRMVLVFFAAGPCGKLWEAAQKDDAYPASLEYIVNTYFQNQIMHLEFFSERDAKEFERCVWSVIGETISRVNCMIKCRVATPEWTQQLQSAIQSSVQLLKKFWL